MNLKKLFIITICVIANLFLAACGTTAPKREALSYYESDEYFEHLYETQNYTPKQKRLVSFGKDLIGTPYVLGSTNPERGLDCSGFTQYVYKHGLDINLPRTARQQNAAGQYVSRQYLLPGDLVFLDLAGDLSHVGIYIGEGRFFHASTSRNRLMVADMTNPYYSQRYDSAVRVARY